jgi:hypothetical protein
MPIGEMQIFGGFGPGNTGNKMQFMLIAFVPWQEFRENLVGYFANPRDPGTENRTTNLSKEHEL